MKLPVRISKKISTSALSRINPSSENDGPLLRNLRVWKGLCRASRGNCSALSSVFTVWLVPAQASYSWAQHMRELPNVCCAALVKYVTSCLRNMFQNLLIEGACFCKHTVAKDALRKHLFSVHMCFSWQISFRHFQTVLHLSSSVLNAYQNYYEILTENPVFFGVLQPFSWAAWLICSFLFVQKVRYWSECATKTCQISTHLL